jgi:pilus assembly protein Flp/PilA
MVLNVLFTECLSHRLGKSTLRGERIKMNNLMLKLFVKMQTLMVREEGQDLVEYALVVALVAFGATAALKTLGTGLNSAFTTISTTLASSLT